MTEDLGVRDDSHVDVHGGSTPTLENGGRPADQIDPRRRACPLPDLAHEGADLRSIG
jgi:hypothetical protein